MSVYIPGRQILRLLLLPDIENIRQAGRADPNPLLETAGNHFRQVNPPPWDGQLGTRKTVGGAGGGRTPSDTFRPVGGRHTDRPDAFGPVESARSSSRLDLRLRKRCQRGFFPCATASRSAPSSPSPCESQPSFGRDSHDRHKRPFGPFESPCESLVRASFAWGPLRNVGDETTRVSQSRPSLAQPLTLAPRLPHRPHLHALKRFCGEGVARASFLFSRVHWLATRRETHGPPLGGRVCVCLPGQTRMTDTNDHLARLSLWFGPVLHSCQAGMRTVQPTA